MVKVSFSDCVGVAGIALAILLVVLDKAGKLRGGWLYGLLLMAGVMTLFIAIGNEWVTDAPAKWRLWRGLLMFCTVGFAYSGLAIWIAPSQREMGGGANEAKTASAPADSERALLLNSINDFISKKDEGELRETFDIDTVTRDAILEAKIQLTPDAATQTERDLLARDMVDGQNVFYFRYVNMKGNNITPVPGKSGVLHLTPKAVRAQKQLTILYLSALTPTDVSEALKDLEKAIVDNQEILMDTINESYAAKPSTISTAFSCPGQDCWAVNNLFYSRFVQLLPKATAITAAMRKHM